MLTLFPVGSWWKSRGRGVYLSAFLLACTPCSKYLSLSSTSSIPIKSMVPCTNEWRYIRSVYLVDLQGHHRWISPIQNHTAWLRNFHWRVRWKVLYPCVWALRSEDRRALWPFDRRYIFCVFQQGYLPGWVWRDRCPYVQRRGRYLGCSQRGSPLPAWLC